MGPLTTILTSVGAVLAIWSISWIVRAQRDNSGERIEEDEARARVAAGQGWDGPLPPPSFSDDELAALSLAQTPLSLEEAGIVARPVEPKPKRSRWRARPSALAACA